MAYQRKTRDRWEVENSEYTREDARRSLREYRENLQDYGKCSVRMIKRRERLEETA